MIVDLKLHHAASKVGSYCIYGVLDDFEDPRGDDWGSYCEGRDCGDCRGDYYARLRKKYEDEVARL